MSTSTVRPAAEAPTTGRTIARWAVSFVGFPLGGLAAMTLVGPVGSAASALAGGLLTGAVLGAAQGWALRAKGRSLAAWSAATAVGLGAGLVVGAAAVSYGTGLGDLVVQGAVSGAAVGIAQAVLLRRRLGALALAWPAYLAVVWAIGWTITTSIGVEVDERFTVFGSSGAVVVAILTSVLPLVLARREAVR
jgi:hypothetical protein